MLPSSLRVAPGWAGRPRRCGGPPRGCAVASARTSGPAPSVTGPSVLCTTTWIAELALPPKCSWASSRAATDSEPSACQPAPDRLASTFGANAPRPTISSSQTTVVSLAWSGHPDAEPAQRAGSVADVGVDGRGRPCGAGLPSGWYMGLLRVRADEVRRGQGGPRAGGVRRDAEHEDGEAGGESCGVDPHREPGADEAAERRDHGQHQHHAPVGGGAGAGTYGEGGGAGQRDHDQRGAGGEAHRQAEREEQGGHHQEAAADAEEPGEQADGRGGDQHLEGPRARARERRAEADDRVVERRAGQVPARVRCRRTACPELADGHQAADDQHQGGERGQQHGAADQRREVGARAPRRRRPPGRRRCRGRAARCRRGTR